jgi:5-methylcytosine-specific restriction endonuclease McrA
MKQKDVLERVLYFHKKHGNEIHKKHFKFPFLIKELLIKAKVPLDYNGNPNYFYNGAMVNYILNNGNFIGDIVPCQLNKHVDLPDEIEEQIKHIDSLSITKFKKEMAKIKRQRKKLEKAHKKQNPCYIIYSKTEKIVSTEEKRSFTKEEYIKKANEFYKSPEWRKVRYEVLREQKGKCQCCGRSAKDGVILHVDHIVPLSKDWSKRLDKNNLQVLCEDCNLGKSNTDSIDWRS